MNAIGWSLCAPYNAEAPRAPGCLLASTPDVSSRRRGNRGRLDRVMPAKGVDMNTPKGRREFMQLAGLGGVVFASGLAGACTNILRKSGGQEDDFFFVQLSDSHWGFKGLQSSRPTDRVDGVARGGLRPASAVARIPIHVRMTNVHHRHGKARHQQPWPGAFARARLVRAVREADRASDEPRNLRCACPARHSARPFAQW